MENASKALIIAGEVLLSIIIISALLLAFNNLSSYQDVKVKSDRATQIVQFNNKYEAYNKDDIRGNTLYSLLNQVVDYNERKSTEGNEGAEVGYQPMTIKIDLNSEDGKNKSELTAPDKKQRIFKEDYYKVDSTNNTFDNLFREIRKLELKYTTGVLNNLANGLTKIFISDDDFNNYKKNNINKAKQIIYNFNSAYGSEKLSADDSKIDNSWSEINEKSEIRENVYTYYEYLQFTRAHFECVNVKYDSENGRIIEMDFQFTGKIN